jgi:ankyrin repeat protein
VKFGADKGPENIIALSKAIELGRINIVNINLRDDSGDTAMHVAVGEGDPSLVHYLIDREADINIPNNNRDTPLQWNLLHQWEYKADHLQPDELRPVIDKTLQEELEMNLWRLRKNRDS